MIRNTSLKHLPSPKALGRALLVVSGVITWLGGAPGANAANCIIGVPSSQLELFPSGTEARRPSGAEPGGEAPAGEKPRLAQRT